MRRWVLACAVMLGTAAPVLAQAGASELTISGFAGGFGTATISDFDNIYLAAATPVTWQLRRINGGGNRSRRMTLTIAATSATFAGGNGTKLIGDLEWQVSTLPGSWQPLSTTPATVVSIVRGNPATTTGNVDLRIRMPWAETPPGNYTATIVWTMTVTPP
jgi:hypothetical protein